MYRGIIAEMIEPGHIPEGYARSIRAQADHYNRCRNEYAAMRRAYLQNQITQEELVKLREMVKDGRQREAMNLLDALVHEKVLR